MNFSRVQSLIEEDNLMSHATSNMRDEFNYAFEGTDVDWVKNLGSPDQALQRLGELWNCTDSVPSHVREEATDWLWQYLSPLDKRITKLRGGCTYAQLVRRLTKTLKLHME